MMRHNASVRAFTLLEILLSITLIVVLFGISLPPYYKFFVKNNLDVAKNQIIQCLRRASFLSAASVEDDTWGVYIQRSSVVIFRGSDYSSREEEYDETYIIPSEITPSGLNEIVFEKMTGLPQESGEIIISSGNDSKTIIINDKGAISVY